MPVEMLLVFKSLNHSFRSSWGDHRKIDPLWMVVRYDNEITNGSEGDSQARHKENYLIFGRDDLRQSAAPAGGPSVMGF
jgi:hypothetical protein